MRRDTQGKALEMACKAFDASLLHVATWKGNNEEVLATMDEERSEAIRTGDYGAHHELAARHRETSSKLEEFEQQRDAWKYVITLILEDETS